MEKDIFDSSFEEIVGNSDNVEEAISGSLEDIKRYEELYLLKSQEDAPIAISELSDEERINLFDT